MWIKLYTKLLDWEWYSDINTTRLFLHCLLKANWQDGKFEGVDVPRGSFVTGRKKLSKETGLTEQQVRTALKRLKSTNEITINTTKKYSIISIVNYDLYQTTNQEDNQQLTNNQPTTNHNLRIIEYKTNTTTTIIKDANVFDYLEKQFGRTLTQLEFERLSKWKDWFSEDIIKYAIDKTISSGVKNLNYTQAIINSWHDKNYKTLEDCKNETKHHLPKLSEEKQNEINELADWNWLEEE